MRRLDFLYTSTAGTVIAIIVLGVYQLTRTGLPSADVIAATQAAHPIINVSDFAPGDVEVLILNDIFVLVWRRNEADKRLAASQNDPSEWKQKHTTIYGQPGPVFADDDSLTIDGEWFIALARPRSGRRVGAVSMSRAGDFGGFFENHYSAHFDLSGRFRRGYGFDNMVVVSGELTEDQSGIRLDLSGVPKPPK
ncbi:hypothetical protein [Leisingera sp. F5]|uniref:hypothetical protein n=1 Tax=Leisingera sp. F5 TaxID=1813816 RepID=UPI000AE74EBF|nr:hypothetical protein [Leisingera sp. F5]